MTTATMTATTPDLAAIGERSWRAYASSERARRE